MFLIFTTLNYLHKDQKRHAMQKNMKRNAGRYMFQLRLEVALNHSRSTLLARFCVSPTRRGDHTTQQLHSAIDNGQKTNPNGGPRLVLRQPLNISPAA